MKDFLLKEMNDCENYFVILQIDSLRRREDEKTRRREDEKTRRQEDEKARR
jgi:hypothetical protein